MNEDATRDEGPTEPDSANDRATEENPLLSKKRLMAKKRLALKRRGASTVENGLDDADIAVINIQVRVSRSRLLDSPSVATHSGPLPVDADPTDPIMDSDPTDLPIHPGPHLDHDFVDGVIKLPPV